MTPAVSYALTVSVMKNQFFCFQNVTHYIADFSSYGMTNGSEFYLLVSKTNISTFCAQYSLLSVGNLAFSQEFLTEYSIMSCAFAIDSAAFHEAILN